MADHVVARVEDLADGARCSVRHGNLEIGVFRLGDRYYALPNVCLHQFGPLCDGKLTGTLVASVDSDWHLQWVREGTILVCPWHGLEFDVTTGQCLGRSKVKLRQFPVRVEDGYVIVSF